MSDTVFALVSSRRMGAHVAQGGRAARVRRGARGPAFLALLAGCASGGGSATPVDFPYLGGAPGVQASTIVHEYVVTSPDLRALTEEIRRVGPRVGGRPFAGATHWNVRWTYRYERVGARCTLRDVRARVENTIQLPRWEPPTPADSAARAWWAGVRRRLVVHEAGHARIGVEGAAEVVRQLRTLSDGSCDALGQRANAAGQAILQQARARDASYDRETAHGARQPGFPPPTALGVAAEALPPVGIAVQDAAGQWCAEFPEGRAVRAGARLTIVLPDPADTVALRARAARRRAQSCATAFAQPRWDSYVAFDVQLLDSVHATVPTTRAALAVAGSAAWTRGPDGVARALLDRDGDPEELRRCLGGEGEHLTVWSIDRAGARRLRAHEYFDLGALVDATCTAMEMGGLP